MKNATSQITCPHCGHQFYAEQALEKQLLARLEKDYQEKTATQAALINQQRAALEKERQRLVEQSADQELLIAKRVEAQLAALAEAERVKAKEEFVQKLATLEEENRSRRDENMRLKKQEVELLQREASLKEAQERLQIDIDRTLLERQSELEHKIRSVEAEKSELRFKEYEKQLADQKRLIGEMKRKAEQGSVQLQGEVQELALEEMLRRQFPFDRIDEVPKGVRGADVVQTVVDSLQRNCGKIIFESKRTKSFNDDWIGKLKQDQADQGAEIAVIVTEAMPVDLKRFGQKDGVWVCNFQEIKGLALVLREMLVRTHSAKEAQENKGDKLEMLYRYLTGAEFTQRIEAIVDGFSHLQRDLDREKKAMQRIWKSREKQIERIVNNTIDMYAAVKGIAGSSIESIPSLELPHIEDEADAAD